MALTEKLTNIANAVRAKTGKADKLTLEQIPIEIAAIETGGASGLQYDMGEFVPTSDIANPTFYHSLGVLPDFVFVWTEDFEGTTNNYENITQLGFFAMRNPYKLPQRLTSTANSAGMGVHFYQAQNASVLTCFVPNSSAYDIGNIYGGNGSDGEKIVVARANSNGRYRAGKVYKYFVCKSWWDEGGV